MKQPEIYIHVGMGRAGSTFFQHQVFPKITGLHYRRKTKFRNSGEVLDRAEFKKYLISDELDNRNVEAYLSDFSKSYNHAHAIILIRRQDEWIASQFKRYLKNGLHCSFPDFFDLENDNGFIKQHHLCFIDFITFIENHFQHKPLIVRYDDFRKKPKAVIQKMVDYMNADISFDEVNMSPRHVSYNEKQLRALYRVSGFINLKRKKYFRIKFMNRLTKLSQDIIRYSILYGALILPFKFSLKNDVLPTGEELKKIREHYSDDWEKCIAKAENV